MLFLRVPYFAHRERIIRRFVCLPDVPSARYTGNIILVSYQGILAISYHRVILAWWP